MVSQPEKSKLLGGPNWEKTIKGFWVGAVFSAAIKL
jgi:hypothetical protein